MTTMNSNQNMRNKNVSPNMNNMNKFGTSDNFQTGSYNVAPSVGKGFKRRNNDQDIYDNRTDGFNKHNDYRRNA